MPITIGTQLGYHEITGLLGKGGMGEVYQGRDLKLKREVAIKILPDEFSSDPERVSRFQREAEVLASLNHPNIGAIYNIEKAGDTRFLVLELVEGDTLAERIQRGAIPVEQALDIATHIADALEAAHEKGVVHRDLKPANVKTTSDGRVKVLDFGLAKAIDEAPVPATASNSPTMSLAATQAGVILGTAAYMSPEQARGRAVDKRSDIWAFGVVLYEMLTGEQLFKGDTVSDTLAAVLRHEIDWKRVPAKAERLLRRSLERDPRLRLRDIGDMRLLLEDPPREIAVSQSTWSRRLGLAGWATAAVLLIALGFAWWASRSSQSENLPLERYRVDLGPNFSPTQTYNAILSPDETRLLYRVHTSEGKNFLAVRSLDQDKETVLLQTENPGATPPFFSPDGRWIAFFSGGKMRKIPVQGGPAVELCDCGTGAAGSWGEDDSIVVPLTATSGLSRVTAGSAKPEPLTTLARGELTHRYPQILPGAKAVLFTAASSIGNFDTANIQVFSLKTGKTKTLVTGYFGRYVPSNGRRGHILYVSQDRVFAIPFDPERLEILGTAQIVVEGISNSSINGAGRFDLSSRPLRSGKFVYREGATGDEAKWQILWLESSGKTSPLVAAPGTYGAIRLSPDERRVAFLGITEKGAGLFVYDSTLDKMTQLTFNGEVVGSPVWAPDGKHLAFRSKEGMSWIRADGGGELQLLLPGQNTPSSFSPDGKHLAYYTIGPETGSDIWTASIDLSDPDHPRLQKPEVFLNSSAGESLPAFSPDGNWIAYRLTTGSGEQSVWVRPFPKGPGERRWQISTDASFPMWSRTQLFFERNDGEIMVVDYEVNGDSFVQKKAHPWSSHHAYQPGSNINIDIAPVGKRFVIFGRPVGAPEPPTHVTFLLNFFDELRRRAPERK